MKKEDVIRAVADIVGPEVESIFKMLVLRDQVAIMTERCEEAIEDGVIDEKDIEPGYDNTKMVWFPPFLDLHYDAFERFQNELLFWSAMTKEKFNASYQWLDCGVAHFEADYEFDVDYEIVRLISDYGSFLTLHQDVEDYDLYITKFHTFEAHLGPYYEHKELSFKEVAKRGMKKVKKVVSRAIKLCSYFEKKNAERKLRELQRSMCA